MTNATAGWREAFDLTPFRFAGGAPVFRDGASSNSLFLIAKGLVKLTCRLHPGDDCVVDLRRPGQLIAQNCLRGRMRALTATAVTDTLLYRVEVDRRRSRDIPAQELLLDHLRLEIGNSISELANSRVSCARVRLESLLQRLGELVGFPASGPSGRIFRVPVSLREMAVMISVTPEHLSRLKKQLRAEGRLNVAGRLWTWRPKPGRAAAVGDHPKY